MSWPELERLHSDIKRIQENKEMDAKVFEKPFLPGTKVCINPEAYKKYNKNINKDAGYVVDMNYDDSNIIHDWRKSNFNVERIKNLNINVKFSRGIAIVKLGDLLSIEAPMALVERIHIQDYGKIYNVNKDEKQLLDDLIIVNNYRISQYIIYDDVWREKILREIEKNQYYF